MHHLTKQFIQANNMNENGSWDKRKVGRQIRKINQKLKKWHTEENHQEKVTSRGPKQVALTMYLVEA